MKLTGITALLFAFSVVGFSATDPRAARAQELKTFVQQEEPKFHLREIERLDVLEHLDRINEDQNQVRSKISDLNSGQQELGMAVDNLSVEVKRQKYLESMQRERLSRLLRIAYRLHREGILRFVIDGKDLTDLGMRVRMIYRTLRSHSLMASQLRSRVQRLAASELRLDEARRRSQHMLVEMKEQEEVLEDLLTQKRRLLKSINAQQSRYHQALREFQMVSKQLNGIFRRLAQGSGRKESFALVNPLGVLPAPIPEGRLVQGFGKQVHERFRTVTFHHGVEIEAPLSSPVKAILDGVVEYEGWVKGLGNVVILHHGDGLYSLSAHLSKTLFTTGTAIKQGDAIALVGDTGQGAKPSLYFELRRGGKAIDPLPYFSKDTLKNLGLRVFTKAAPNRG